MQSKAATVKEYLAELPPERRAAIGTVRKLVLKLLSKGFEEGMGYGMICFSVPHSRYPDGYHCKPEQALPFAALASQKQYMSLYLCTQYATPAAEKRFRADWDAAVRAGQARKLDMGKSCIRFKRVEDLALDVIASSVGSMSVDEFVEFYERSVLSKDKQASARRAARDAERTKPTAKKAPAKRAPAKKAKTSGGRRATAKGGRR